MSGIKQKIVPHLWFDREAREAAELYAAALPDAKVTNITTLHDPPSGDCDVVSFELWGYSFMAISAGPYFRLNPSISFMLNFDPSQDKDAKARIDAVWARLSESGKVLMPLDKYPFSERYGWVQDKYGLSWQLILTNPEGEERPLVIPSLLFVGKVCGKAEEASDFYLSVFEGSPAAKAAADTKRGAIARYGAGQEPDKEGTVMFTDFKLGGQWFAAMDSAHEHAFQFNEAVSFMVNCRDQAEIDYFWEKLSADPNAEQCGWLKDKYGVSWQIVPAALGGMMRDPDPGRVARVTQAFLKMKKFDLAALQSAYEGN
jgi:predicted 3-demethylubiquinone-9 3-methyltransferase (glyoxalase superfamily)